MVLQHRPILYDRILVDDDDPFMDRVHRKVPFLAGYVINADTTSITNASILVNDGLSDDSSLSYAYVGDAFLRIFLLFLFRLVEGGTHAVDTVQGGTTFNQEIGRAHV